MLFKCFFCNKESNTQFAVEHIIPQAIGGRLQTTDFCCTKCNSMYGKTIDLDLINNFNFICTILNIKRDRKRPPDIFLKSLNTSEKFRITNSNKISRKKRIVKVSNNKLHIYYQSESELNESIEGFKKSGKILKLNKLTEGEPGEIRNFNKVSFKFYLGNSNVFRAIVKSAILFYLHKNGLQDFLSPHLKFYINNNKDALIVCPFYCKDSPVIKLEENKILHVLHLEGNSSSKQLYVVLLLFNVFKYIIFLDMNYQGPNMKETYSINILNGKIEDLTFDINLSRNFRNINSYPFIRTQMDSEWNLFAKLLSSKLLKKQVGLRFAKPLHGYPKGTILTEELAQII